MGRSANALVLRESSDNGVQSLEATLIIHQLPSSTRGAGDDVTKSPYTSTDTTMGHDRAVIYNTALSKKSIDLYIYIYIT